MNYKDIISKNFKKLDKISNKIDKIKKDIDIIWDEKEKLLLNSNGTFNKNIFDKIELNQKYQSLTEESEKLNKKQKILEIEYRIVENNNYYILGQYTINEIYPILHKYDNKKIGEKTRLKIYQEIEEKVTKDISKDLNVYVNIYREYEWSSYKTLKLDFTFSLKDDYKRGYVLIIDMYSETHKINTNFKNFIYSEDTAKDAKTFYNNRLKLNDEINKTIEKYQDKISNFNKTAIGNLQTYRLETIYRK